MTRPIRILGIDPGLRRTGWGMVEVAGNRLGFLGCGSVTTRDEDTLAARLLAIHDGLLRVLNEFRPDEAAVEATFVNKDAKATLKLGQARGIAMVVPARAGTTMAIPRAWPSLSVAFASLFTNVASTAASSGRNSLRTRSSPS